MTTIIIINIYMHTVYYMHIGILGTKHYQYSEMNDGLTDTWAISNGKYKLIVNSSGLEQMYNLTDDPYENNDLIIGALTSDQESAKTRLESELLDIRN